jgi:hypothetical protein
MQQAELNRQNLLAYRQRWTAVAAVEAAERQSSSTAERWQQLNALYRLALSLNILPQNQDIALSEGQQRWQALYALEKAKSK